jgi:hypothetical protein
MGFEERPTTFQLAMKVPELRAMLLKIGAIPDSMKDALNKYMEAHFPFKEEEQRKLDGYDDILKHNVKLLVDYNRRRRTLLNVIIDEGAQKEAFGRYLTEEEAGNLRALAEFTHGEFEALENQIAKAYAVSKALKEYGWDQHYSERAELIERSRKWILEAQERGELE